MAEQGFADQEVETLLFTLASARTTQDIVSRLEREPHNALPDARSQFGALRFAPRATTPEDSLLRAPTFRSTPTSRTAGAPKGLAIDKSNWANTLDAPPYEAYAVTYGVTFTFGGLRITTDGEVLNTDYRPIRGLYAAGELVGGLFYFNYPGGTGLMAGSVFGRIAGNRAGSAGRN